MEEDKEEKEEQQEEEEEEEDQDASPDSSSNSSCSSSSSSDGNMSRHTSTSCKAHPGSFGCWRFARRGLVISNGETGVNL